jgi:hypothetical protein
VAKPSPFEYVKGLTSQRDPVAAGELDVRDFNVFMACRALGHRMDSQSACELVNMSSRLSKAAAWRVLRATIVKRAPRRDEAWAKTPKTDGVQAIKDHFGVGEQRALDILETIGEEGLAKIADSKGGMEKKRR